MPVTAILHSDVLHAITDVVIMMYIIGQWRKHCQYTCTKALDLLKLNIN